MCFGDWCRQGLVDDGELVVMIEEGMRAEKKVIQEKEKMEHTKGKGKARE